MIKVNTFEKETQDNFRQEIARDTQFYYSHFPLKDYFIQPLTLSTTLKQIDGFLQLENVCRPFFEVKEEKREVSIPCLFTLLTGLPEHKDMYWEKINEYKSLPYVTYYETMILHSETEEGTMKSKESIHPHYYITGVMELEGSFEDTEFLLEGYETTIPAFEREEEVFLWIQGVLDEPSKANQLLRSSLWRHDYLSYENQQQFLRTIMGFLQEVQRYAAEEIKAEDYREIFLTLSSMPKDMVLQWLNYDLPYFSPKMVIFLKEKEQPSWRDMLVWIFLHHIGFDIVVFDPMNQHPFSYFMKGELLDTHSIGKSVERVESRSNVHSLTTWWKKKVKGVDIWT